jgi:hypothetical protein
MKISQGTQIRLSAGGMFLALFVASFMSAQMAAPPPPSDKRSLSIDQVPDSPSTVQARLNRPQALTLDTARTNPSPSSDPVPTPAPTGDVPQDKPASTDPSVDQPSDRPNPHPSSSIAGQAQQKTPHEPVGTAVAEPIQTTGVAAARPVGAAVAPGKQRRTRSILIKVGSLVGVGVAIGTTLALSQGSPSRPPGSH